MAVKNHGIAKESDLDKRRHLYEQALRCIDREENLIHYRMSWGLQWNVGGFAMLVVLLSSSLPDYLKVVAAAALSLFGIGVCVIAFIAVVAAHEQSRFVIDTLCERLGVDDHDWSESEFIRPYGENRVHRRARIISKYLFVMIVALWLGVIYVLLTEGVDISFAFPRAEQLDGSV